MEDGGHETCPVLSLFFRRESDFLAQRVDPHFGNWRDDWPLTAALRTDLNERLGRHKLGADYISPRTFIFLRSWEDIVIDLLGRRVKPQILRSIREMLADSAEAPQPEYLFWHSSRCYFVVFKNAAHLQVASAYKEQMELAARQILLAADLESYCADYSVEMRLKHLEMEDLEMYGMWRED